MFPRSLLPACATCLLAAFSRVASMTAAAAADPRGTPTQLVRSQLPARHPGTLLKHRRATPEPPCSCTAAPEPAPATFRQRNHEPAPACTELAKPFSSLRKPPCTLGARRFHTPEQLCAERRRQEWISPCSCCRRPAPVHRREPSHHWSQELSRRAVSIARAPSCCYRRLSEAAPRRFLVKNSRARRYCWHATLSCAAKCTREPSREPDCLRAVCFRFCLSMNRDR